MNEQALDHERREARVHLHGKVFQMLPRPLDEAGVDRHLEKYGRFLVGLENVIFSNNNH